MNNRYKLPIGLQRKYLNKVEKISNLSIGELAHLFGIVPRSYHDWKREKFAITEKAVNTIWVKYRIKLPYSKQKALRNWLEAKKNACVSGGIARIAKYGQLGTLEGRKLGGKHTMVILRQRGLIPKGKPFNEPEKYSSELAELVGILLGDGHIGNEQWSITLNAIKDYEYSLYVNNLIKKLFGFIPTSKVRNDSNVIVITGSGKRSINYFLKLGLKIGNKVKQQVDVPDWIKLSKKFKTTCLRGLVDTDGGIFNHRYTVNKKKYSYKKLNFVNRSVPLLKFVHKTLGEFNFHPKIILNVENKRVWLYNESEVKRYLNIIGTNNTRLLKN